MAATLLRFGRERHKQGQGGGDEVELMFCINLAQSYKWMKKDAESKEVLANIDWSTRADKFLLAKAVLEDDFSTAAKTMLKIGPNGDMLKNFYREWPLFKAFRKSQEFLDAYKAVFGETFEPMGEQGPKVVEEVPTETNRLTQDDVEPKAVEQVPNETRRLTTDDNGKPGGTSIADR